MSEPQYDEKGNFEGFQPRECGEHRTVGTYRAWCHGCGEWCYPRIAAACDGCRNPVIEKLLDDMADVLNGVAMAVKNATGGDLSGVSGVLARYRAYKESE